VLKSWERKAWHGFLKEAFGLKAWVMIKKKVQSSWRSRKNIRDGLQNWGLHQIIKIIGHYLVHLLYKCHICLYFGIRP
jgi:hypothetical protein